MIREVMIDLANRLGIVGELLRFLWKRRLWWLVPMVVLLFIFGVLLIFTQVVGVGPFIYSLF
jgi:hypothetical protein